MPAAYFLFHLLFLLLFAGHSALGQDQASERGLDQEFARLWAARTTRQAEKASRRIIESECTFEQAWQRLRAGRPYSGEVETGLRFGTRVGAMGVRHHYAFRVPKTYDPTNRYPVRFYLHGGIEREAWDPGGGWWPTNKLMDHPQRIAVFPSAWSESRWWEESQVKNLSGILQELKRRYNIDENRVSLIGVSDGGTGTWFQAFRSTTTWAAFLPFISHPAVLGQRTIGVDGDIFPVNLMNKPFFVVNGAYDHLYPSARVVPYLALFEAAGAQIEFRHQPDSGHDTRWWPSEISNIDNFLETHPRDPFPDQLIWETELQDRYNRAHWLIIDELGAVQGESRLPGWNTVQNPYKGPSLGLIPRDVDKGLEVVAVHAGGIADTAGLEPGDLVVELQDSPEPSIAGLAETLLHVTNGSQVPIQVRRGEDELSLVLSFPGEPQPPYEAFPRGRSSGRVQLQRHGNTVTALTQGVRRFRLLISPDQFRIQEPIVVVCNGQEVFRGRVEKSLSTLLYWAVRDNDRTMLFAAEVEVDLTGR